METKKLILANKVEKLLKDNRSTKVKSLKRKMDTTLFYKLSKRGLIEKAEYRLPLADTLGRGFFEASNFRNK